MEQKVFLIFSMDKKKGGVFYKLCFFFEKTKQKKCKRVASKRRKFENFTYEIKKQKTSSSDENLFSPTATEGSLTQELP